MQFSSIILALMYSYVIVMVKKVMGKFQGDFENEIWSVNTQFYVFFVAQLVRIAYLIPYEISRIRNFENVEFFNILFFVFAFLTQILPVFVVLLLHHRAFGARTLAESMNQMSDRSNSPKMI